MSQDVPIRVEGDGPAPPDGPNLMSGQHRTVSSGGPPRCPLGHDAAGKDPRCVLCAVAERDPRYYDVWAGRPVDRSKTPPPAVLMTRRVEVGEKAKPACEGDCPGTELKLLLAVFGINTGNCQCDKHAEMMDAWGAAGCEDHEREILEWLNAEYKRLGWGKSIKAGVAALKAGMALRFNPFDPAPGLLREAIRRARTKSGGLKDGAPIPPWEEGSTALVPTGEVTGVVGSVTQVPPSPQGADREVVPAMARSVTWACGVTTVPKRRGDLLPRTLLSLRRAGFDAPRLFVDGADGGTVAGYEVEFGLPVTGRHPNVLVSANWFMSMHELFVRDPMADRYAMFQDDVVCCLGLRDYLSAATYPHRGYLNLYTFPDNQRLAPGGGRVGFYPSNQKGLGAVATVFDREAMVEILRGQHLVTRPLDGVIGLRAVDGGIVESMRKAGFREFVHDPSLVQHTGRESSSCGPTQPTAPSFPGEDWDATAFLKMSRL